MELPNEIRAVLQTYLNTYITEIMVDLPVSREWHKWLTFEDRKIMAHLMSQKAIFTLPDGKCINICDRIIEKACHIEQTDFQVCHSLDEYVFVNDKRMEFFIHSHLKNKEALKSLQLDYFKFFERKNLNK